jgi:hypothetical protein
MLKKILAFAAAGLLGLTLAGCAASTSDGSSPESASVSAEIVGQVVKTDDNSILINVGIISTPPGKNSSDSDAPAAPPADPSGAPPTMPQNGAPSEGPSGQTAPFGDGLPAGSFPGFTATGESQTITITASTVITQEGPAGDAAGSAPDIEVGDIIKVTMTDTTATAVTILSPNNQMEDHASDGA